MCDHLHVEIYATGGMHFTPTDGPWDDIEMWCRCVDCGLTWKDNGEQSDANKEDQPLEEIPF